MTGGIRLTMSDSQAKPKRLHDLIKAPENSEWTQKKKHSWSAEQPATVYYTPEMLEMGGAPALLPPELEQADAEAEDVS